MLQSRLILVVVAPLLIAAAVAVGSRVSATDSMESYRRARATFDASVEALGGGETISSVANTAFAYRGVAVGRGQSASPGSDYQRQPIEGRFVFEAGGRVRHEMKTVFRGGLKVDLVRIFSDSGGFQHRLDQDELHTLSAFDVGILKGAPAVYPPRALPHALVRSASANRASLRWLGETSDSGETLQRVSFSDDDGTQMTMVIDAATRLPQRLEYLSSDILLGDAQQEVRFSDYRETTGVQVPHRLAFVTGGEVVGEWTLDDVKLNAKLDEEIFSQPEHPAPTKHPPWLAPREIAEGVYTIRVYSGTFIYNNMFVMMDDHVVVIEAPLVDGLHPFVTQAIESVAPGLPVRYVVTTHYHFDHSGGVKAFIAAGATIITTPGTGEFIKRMAAAEHTISVNPVPAGVEPRLELFNETKVIGDGSREIQLYNVGPTPHVDEIVIAYLPQEKILFVADLLSIPPSHHFAPPSETLKDFAEKLERLGLDVETIVPGHGVVGTRADLEAALAGGGLEVSSGR